MARKKTHMADSAATESATGTVKFEIKPSLASDFRKRCDDQKLTIKAFGEACIEAFLGGTLRIIEGKATCQQKTA
jgi:hypothetical protein